MSVVLAEEKTVSLDVFRKVSSLVTLRDNLDADTVSRMYKVFLDEPWAPDHILRVHNKIVAGLANGLSRKNHLMKDLAWKFDEGESWFAGHLLMTWYLGVYYHAERPTQRVAYETALMFDSTRGILPIPLVESLGFGGWTDAPEDAR